MPPLPVFGKAVNCLLALGLAPGQHQVSAARHLRRLNAGGDWAPGTPAADPGPVLAPRARSGPWGRRLPCTPRLLLPAGAPAPSLRLPHQFSLFSISIRLGCPVLLPGAFSRRRFLGWRGLALGLVLPFSGGRCPPLGPQPPGGRREAQMQSQARCPAPRQAPISLLRPTGIPPLAVASALVLRHLYWTK